MSGDCILELTNKTGVLIFGTRGYNIINHFPTAFAVVSLTCNLSATLGTQHMRKFCFKHEVIIAERRVKVSPSVLVLKVEALFPLLLPQVNFSNS